MPKYGTLEEVLFMLVWQKRQSIQAAQTRAVAQAALGGKEAEKAYAEFVEELSSMNVSAQRKVDPLKKHFEAMKNITAIKVAPLSMTPNKQKTIKRVKR